MMEIPGTTRAHPGREVLATLAAVRAEALFASTMQASGPAAPDQVRRAVATTLQRWGVRGCAARMAGEFGDHPDTAVARMNWALATIQSAYPALSMTLAADLRLLAVAN
jgi:hypothetical protein